MLPPDLRVLNEGERYLPSAKAYNAAMHLGHMASYREALRYAYGRRILDLGCGVGYGAHYLAYYGARQVVGVDRSAVALEYGRRVYSHVNLTYAQADGLALPFAGQAFDVVFSSQVIEHVPSVEGFLREVERLLAPGGLCLLVTPNLELFSPGGTTANPHHVNEMSWPVFRRATSQVFPRAEYRGIPQRCLMQLEPGAPPATKPNAEIRQSDYRVQADRLAECENMLCYGLRDEASRLAPTLPAHVRPAADELAPAFWDAAVGRWVVMGQRIEAGAPALALTPTAPIDVHFRSCHPALYRVELELAAPAEAELRLTLRAALPQGLGPIVTRQVLRPSHGRYYDLLFDPQTESLDQEFRLTVEMAGAWRRWFTRLPAAHLAGGPPESSGAGLRTFHRCLPEPAAGAAAA